MLKTTTAIMVAATIAAAVTVLSAPTAQVDASPLAQPAEPLEGLHPARLALPQLRRHPFGNPRIRLVSTDGWRHKPVPPLRAHALGSRQGHPRSRGEDVMRRLVLVAFALLCGGASLRAVLSGPSDPHHRADAGRRPGRRDGAAHRQRAAGEPRAERLRREQAGRRQYLGSKMAADAAPDGYTLMVSAASGLIMSPMIYSNAGYDASSFAPVALIAETPQLLVVNPNLPVKTVAELVAYAKANPGKLNYSTGGIGTLPHLVRRTVQEDHRHAISCTCPTRAAARRSSAWWPAKRK